MSRVFRGFVMWAAVLLESCTPSAEVPAGPKPGRARASVEDGGERKWFEQEEIRSSRGRTEGRFGRSIAMAGDVAVIGAPGEDREEVGFRGAAYVFERSDAKFQERQRLTVLEPGVWDDFGSMVAIAGTTILVSAPMRAATYAFELENGRWEQQQTLVGANESAVGDGVIAGLGDKALVGAPQSGALRMFERSGEGWVRTRTVTRDPNEPWYALGFAVAISDRWAVASALVLDTSITADGVVYVFDLSAPADSVPHKLLPSDALGQDEASPSRPPMQSFGASVAIVDDTIYVGAPSGDADANGRFGGVYVFEWSGATWIETEKLTLAHKSRWDGFGGSVVARKDMLLLSSQYRTSDSAPAMGVIDVLVKTQSGWVLDQTFTAKDAGPGQEFGGAIAVSGDTALIGAPRRLEHGSVFVAELRRNLGVACSEDTDCGSEHCKSGVCCDRSCGPCATCATGTCVELPPLSAGVPSCHPYLCDGERDLCPASCLESAACAAGHSCEDGRCVEQSGIDAPCEADEQCRSGRCAGGRCRGTRSPGDPCSEDAQCETGHCTDAVCCDQACDGQCEACDVPEALGTCSAIEGAPHGDRPACDGESPPCAGACTKQDRAACGYAPATTTCGSECSNGSQTDKVCDGRGECVDAGERSCNNVICEGSRCKDKCQSVADCLQGFTCDSGRCVPRPTCIDDHTSQGANGIRQDCAAYRCELGRCKTSCEHEGDCVLPNVCLPGRKTCGQPELPDSSAGCAHSTARDRDDRSSWIGIVLGVGTLGFARQRRRRALRAGQGRQS